MGRGVDEWVGPESRELPRAGSAAHWGPETEVSTSFASVHKSLASAMPIFSQVCASFGTMPTDFVHQGTAFSYGSSLKVDCFYPRERSS